MPDEWWPPIPRRTHHPFTCMYLTPSLLRRPTMSGHRFLNPCQQFPIHGIINCSTTENPPTFFQKKKEFGTRVSSTTSPGLSNRFFFTFQRHPGVLAFLMDILAGIFFTLWKQSNHFFSTFTQPAAKRSDTKKLQGRYNYEMHIPQGGRHHYYFLRDARPSKSDYRLASFFSPGYIIYVLTTTTKKEKKGAVTASKKHIYFPWNKRKELTHKLLSVMEWNFPPLTLWTFFFSFFFSFRVLIYIYETERNTSFIIVSWAQRVTWPSGSQFLCLGISFVMTGRTDFQHWGLPSRLRFNSSTRVFWSN